MYAEIAKLRSCSIFKDYGRKKVKDKTVKEKKKDNITSYEISSLSYQYNNRELRADGVRDIVAMLWLM